MLLYVGGEGGVGKSQIIKATTAAMDLLHRKNEIILMAPTGAAADVIGGSTYHTSLGISLNRYQRTGVGQRVRRLWTQKTIMFIDEVSMVDLSALSIINTHCKIARSLERSSPDLFGGLPVVILMGDFYQFPPVQGQPYGNLREMRPSRMGSLSGTSLNKSLSSTSRCARRRTYHIGTYLLARGLPHLHTMIF
jgi:hypothetical protein